MLAGKFQKAITGLGMERLEHPLFCHAPVGIRFEIGEEEPIYLDRSAAKLKTNPAYVQGALDRAAAIYRALPAAQAEAPPPPRLWRRGCFCGIDSSTGGVNPRPRP